MGDKKLEFFCYRDMKDVGLDIVSSELMIVKNCVRRLMEILAKIRKVQTTPCWRWALENNI